MKKLGKSWGIAVNEWDSYVLSLKLLEYPNMQGINMVGITEQWALMRRWSCLNLSMLSCNW